MFGLDNPIHIAFLLILLLLVFGAKRLPEMGRSLGAGMRGFKESISGESGQTSITASQPARASTASIAPGATGTDAPAVAAVGAPVQVAAPAAAPVEEPTPPLAA
ncbi:MAG TPA: twin-arginine translocase TatA/TatE family subunit [Solirubrobacteraceae bacterium]|nr:twin-arginine translocase TatA/TatE family subunit [Solirubrobacteraceae bacterium]